MARFIQFRSITPSTLNMPFHVCHQVACPNRCIATLVAFIWLFAAMSFEMHPQIACLRGCKVTLVAFVWFFSTVGFQMCPQGTCMSRSIVALAALLRFFSIFCLFCWNLHISFASTWHEVSKILIHCQQIESFVSFPGSSVPYWGEIKVTKMLWIGKRKSESKNIKRVVDRESFLLRNNDDDRLVKKKNCI